MLIKKESGCIEPNYNKMNKYKETSMTTATSYSYVTAKYLITI